MYRFTALVILSFAAAVPLEEHKLWNEFKLAHSKEYKSTQEEQYRQQVFLDNLREIQEHNVQYEAGLTTYMKGINEFADMTDEEFKGFLLISGPPPEMNETTKLYEPAPGDNLPKKVDWREKNAVNPARKQGGCGACWAFSAVGTLEGINYLKTGNLYQLSIQNLIDCSFDQGNYACLGGWAVNGLKYVKKYGIEKEQDYPYEAARGQCRYDASKVVVKIKDFVQVPKADIPALQSAVATVGPVSISVDAKEFKLYKKGVFYAKQPFEKINHGVILDGYGTDNGEDYWLIRNTWGPTWGEKGYIRVAIKMKNLIGVTSKACYPVI